ncbi:hypothetical protein EMMF5_005796 [Cystobasidiomycetes sp. EMM_F5]
MSAAVNAPRAISKEAMRMTEKLHKLRNGPGAFELPREIKEIEMTFAAKNRDYGARHFYRNALQSLMYTNPDVKFNVQRIPPAQNKSAVILKYRDGSDKVLRVQHKKDSHLLNLLRHHALGEPLLPTPPKPQRPSAVNAKGKQPESSKKGAKANSVTKAESPGAVAGNASESTPPSSTAIIAPSSKSAKQEKKDSRRKPRSSPKVDALEGTPAPNEGTEQGVALGTERQ